MKLLSQVLPKYTRFSRIKVILPLVKIQQKSGNLNEIFSTYSLMNGLTRLFKKKKKKALLMEIFCHFSYPPPSIHGGEHNTYWALINKNIFIVSERKKNFKI